jgi:hypothetical protein
LKILLVHNLPRHLKPLLAPHEVISARELAWHELKNGILLAAAEEVGFDLLLTEDKNMSYQQNLAGRRIAIRVLSQQQWPILRLHVNLITEAIADVTPGSFAQIELPPD